ncbi:galanin peptides-like isoform X3 [Protopterus annectens]|uniref:galanin peptides-like isoform X3 n=1 Tax=Protopterus annectens TaxID=7888 RepID=UPI001CFB3511|nr:galanin peptides-like isoform X3 [Protopterus annectens]
MVNTMTLLCVSLILCGVVTECFSLAIMPKDKRGWTLNSAGYLLGPHAHRTLNDKGGLAGKRDTMEEVYKTAGEPFSNPLHSLDDSTLQLVLDFLSYLHLKELGALENLNLPFSSEESTQP